MAGLHLNYLMKDGVTGLWEAGFTMLYFLRVRRVCRAERG